MHLINTVLPITNLSWDKEVAVEEEKWLLLAVDVAAADVPDDVGSNILHSILLSSSNS